MDYFLSIEKLHLELELEIELEIELRIEEVRTWQLSKHSALAKS